MKKTYIISLIIGLVISNVCVFSQSLTGDEVIDKSIRYHDPNGLWSTINTQFTIFQNTPDKPQTKTDIKINNAIGFFEFSYKKEGHKIQYFVKGNDCSYACDGMSNVPDSMVTQLKLDVKRGKRIRNYYTYLWGLPMKLKDTGTIIHQSAENVEFHNKKAFKVKVSYIESVGDDIWYFYFDINTFALIAYEFYHEESKKDGEYILLEKECDIEGMKIPQERSWYAHKKDYFLGKDKIINRK